MAIPKTRSSTKKSPSSAKPVRTSPKTSSKKVSAKTGGGKGASSGAAPPPNAIVVPEVDKHTSIDSLFIVGSGSDVYTIFGPRGPALWSQSLDFSAADRSLWRRVLSDPAAHEGETWRFQFNGEAYTYTFRRSPEVRGNVLAEMEEELPPLGDGEDRSGPLVFAGARHGTLYMVFAGWPTSFGEDDFRPIYEALRICGAVAAAE